MADKQKPPRRRMGFFDAQDRVFKLNSLYRGAFILGGDRVDKMASKVHAELDEVATAEPDEELEDSELSDAERNSAIARERMRRGSI